MANLNETATWENGIYQLEKTDPVVGGPDGISNRQAKELANRTLYLKEFKADINSPVFQGVPKAPTPAQDVNDGTIATTAFVKAALAALIGNAPAALDTLAELATALGNDKDFKAKLLGEIAKKANSADVASKEWLIGIPIPYPKAAPPAGFIAMTGQAISQSVYPVLHSLYGDRLPDLRGEFIRGWDNGRGVDAGRALLSAQKGTLTSDRDDAGQENAFSFRSDQELHADVATEAEYGKLHLFYTICPVRGASNLVCHVSH